MELAELQVTHNAGRHTGDGFHAIHIDHAQCNLVAAVGQCRRVQLTQSCRRCGAGHLAQTTVEHGPCGIRRADRANFEFIVGKRAGRCRTGDADRAFEAVVALWTGDDGHCIGRGAAAVAYGQ